MAKKKLVVNLKPIKQDIERVIKTLSGFKSKVSDADSERIDLKIKHLDGAIKDLKQACKNAKMTPGFSPE
jgi:hypothetical protein